MWRKPIIVCYIMLYVQINLFINSGGIHSFQYFRNRSTFSVKGLRFSTSSTNFSDKTFKMKLSLTLKFQPLNFISSTETSISCYISIIRNSSSSSVSDTLRESYLYDNLTNMWINSIEICGFIRLIEVLSHD